MYRAMYERKYHRSADNTTDDDKELAQFVYEYVILNSLVPSLWIIYDHCARPPVKKGKGKRAWRVIL